MQNHLELEPNWRGIFRSGLCPLVVRSRALLLQGPQLVKRLLTLGRLAPQVHPVDLDVAVSLDDLDDVIGRVSIRWAWGSIAGEVVENFDRVLASYEASAV
jgi:hypothetical protein